MPNPYRHYDGVPVLDLPADPEPPAIAAWDVLRGVPGETTARDGAGFLSQLFFHTAAVSATKVAPGSGMHYSLRVNPSSGNLHPTEFHFSSRGLAGWPDGLYHYRPSQHMAEQRAAGHWGFEGSLEFVLTSIAWREAWKYRDRAYRYCLLDMGHAWEALALAARALGCECRAAGSFDEAELTDRLALAEDEWPLLVVTINGAPSGESGNQERDWFGGAPNQLSDEPLVPPLIEQVHQVTGASVVPWTRRHSPSGAAPLGGRGFGETVRARRSALNFVGGEDRMTMAQLLALLSLTNGSGLVLYLYLHRVDGLAPGLYRYDGELELLRSGDQRVVAAGLSLGQDLAGNCCVAISMIADLDRITAEHGDRGYRYAHFEAGALGQRLYVGATAFGLAATGIGAFFDDRVHEYLDLREGQVIYHFAIGYPVVDTRLEP